MPCWKLLRGMLITTSSMIQCWYSIVIVTIVLSNIVTVSIKKKTQDAEADILANNSAPNFNFISKFCPERLLYTSEISHIEKRRGSSKPFA